MLIVGEVRGMLTGGGGLARIDVADNDHVDVHLFLTIRQRLVSQESIKICDDICMMFSQRDRWHMLMLTHPMIAVLFLLTIWFGFVILRKES